MTTRELLLAARASMGALALAGGEERRADREIQNQRIVEKALHAMKLYKLRKGSGPSAARAVPARHQMKQAGPISLPEKFHQIQRLIPQ